MSWLLPETVEFDKFDDCVFKPVHYIGSERFEVQKMHFYGCCLPWHCEGSLKKEQISGAHVTKDLQAYNII